MLFAVLTLYREASRHPTSSDVLVIVRLGIIAEFFEEGRHCLRRESALMWGFLACAIRWFV